MNTTFKSKFVIFFILQFFVTSCFNQSSLQKRTEINYQKAKKEFNEILIDHFPKSLSSEKSLMVYTTNIEKNNVFMMLCEYDIDDTEIAKIKSDLLNRNNPFYNANDSCLLIINRFETMETSENLEIVTSIDTSKVNKQCYEDLQPIPNFIDVENPVKNSDIKLNSSFAIFVIDSKSGNHFSEYNLLPSPQMPEKWKNGYSKGIAISEKERTVIYWGIAW